MLLTFGDCSQLKGQEWCMLEVRSEKTIEPTLRRIGKQIPSIFNKDAIEIFIPVGKRDLDVFDLSAAAYLFVRSKNFPGLLRLKTITGVVSLVTEGDSNRPSKVIKVPDNYVQDLVKVATKQFDSHSAAILPGSFVRVLNGDTRDFCGTVTAIGGDRAIVRIAMKTKSIVLDTPIRNLLNLSHTPEKLRTYYFCPLVESLVDSDNVGLITPDTHLGSQPLISIAKPQVKTETAKKARQRTVTALVRKLVLVEKIHTPKEIMASVAKAIKKSEVKAPKNLFIIYTIIKDNIMEHWAKKEAKGIKSYRDVVRHFGDTYKFSAKDMTPLLNELALTAGGKNKA